MCSRTNIVSPSIPSRKSTGLVATITGQFRMGRPSACLQRIDDGAIIATSAARATRIVTPSASISMPPISGLALRRAVLRSRPAIATGAMASTTAGTNCGSSAIGVGCRRACRRQVNTCCGGSPCRRAISETTAPGTSVSSTIRALSSLENQRRRPVSVITSSGALSRPT